MQKLNVLRQMGEKVADEFAVREAMQIIRDPRRRLLAEIFWFHVDGLDEAGSESPVALQAMREGQWPRAQEIWMREMKERKGSLQGLRAWHNLAVLFHARVVTVEVGSNPLIKKMPSNCYLPEEHLKSWQMALRAWNSYFVEERAWKWWKERARGLDDKRIDADFVDQLREVLPDVFLQINRDLARQYADVGFGFAAAQHCRLMLDGGGNRDRALSMCRTVLDPIKRGLLAPCEAWSKLDDDLIDWNKYQTFLNEIEPRVTLISQIDPKREFGASVSRETAARAVASCASGFARRRDFEHAFEILSKAFSWADSPTLRHDIEESRERTRTLRTTWERAPRTCLCCLSAPVDWTILTNRQIGDSRVVFLCAKHSESNQQEKVFKAAEFKWVLLPRPQQ